MNRPSVVIKVKHGKTLRRFSAFVNEDQHLDLDMGRLRTKICSLFNFAPDADFTLTYVDEDDDQVTLADDEDLHDVMRQGLNPVRITVHLNAEKGAQSSSTKSTESPSPTVSSSQNSQGKNPNVIVNEILNSVPVHLSDALSKLSHELASKAAITSPVLGEVISSLSKVGESLLNASHSPSGTATASTNEVHGDQQNTSATEKQSASTGVGEKSGGVEGSTSGPSNSTTTEGAKQAEPVKPPQQPPFVLHKGKNANHGYCHYMPMGDVNNKDKGVATDPAWKCFGDSRKKDKEIKGDSAEGARCNVFDSVRAQMEKNLKLGKETSSGENKGFNWGGTSSKSAVNPFVMDTCPFSGLPMQSPVGNAPYMPPPIQHFKRSFNDSADGVGSIFHKGVRCDGCGVLPITGPRFKSKVKHNYDLCSICFSRMGNASDYARIDFPLPYRHPWTFKGFYDPYEPTGLPQVPPLLRPFGSKHHRSRLDSRFIMDVNVMDGTLMPPSTPFTKIWRMRNNGTLPWTRGLQLLWIGGDRFSSSDSFEIEIPVGGVNVGNEIDVAVDFIAPELPGRYISYWRMADATGHKFGQRVWVLIQVDASLRDTETESSPVLKSGEPSENPDASAHESSPVVDLNLPPENTTGFSVQENPSAENLNLNENVDPVGDLEAGNLNSAPEEGKSSPSVTEQQTRKVEILDMNFPINDDLLINNDGSSSSSSSSPHPPHVKAGNPPSLAVASAPLYPELGIPTIIQQKLPGEASSLNTPASSSSVQYPDSAVDASALPMPFRFFYPGDNVSARSPPVSPSPSTISYPTVDMPQPTPPTISYPIIDMSEKSSIPSSSAAARGDDSDKKADDQVNGVVNEVEENLLKELAEMGFKQVELNKEVLRQNEYDLQRSVDELCGVHEWDPILEELKEMGFQDKETNRRLLVKNNGSIMRVVMDLIAGEKA